MYRVTKLLFLILLIPFLNINASGIFDSIQEQRLVAGKTKTIIASDLFYADEYDLLFKPNKYLTVRYNKSTLKLELTSEEDFNGLTFLDFDLDGKTYSIPVISKIIEEFTFKYKPLKEFKTISLFGSFNSWNRGEYFLTDTDGVFEVKVNLNPGRYEYKFWGDGQEIVDPSNPDSISNGMGAYNSVFHVKDKFDLKSFLHIGDMENEDGTLSLNFKYEVEGNFDPKKLRVYASVNNQKLTRKNLVVNKRNVTAKLSGDMLKGKSVVWIAASYKGIVSNIQKVILFDGNPAGAENTPFTWHDATMYSLMIDRFYDGDSTLNNPVKHDSLMDKANYFGGDLAGVIKKLEEGYFDKLGINTLWISPVNDGPNTAYKEFPAPHRWFSGYHGYWPIDHQRVEEKFGTLEDVKTLVKVAKKHGIKVLLDFVSNHVHKEHPFYKEHPEWFGKLILPDGRRNLRFWDEFRLTTWFEPYMPSFDYSNKEALETMTDNAIWWLKNTGAAGFRHDAVKHVPNEFWRELTRKIKKEFESKTHKHVYQIGETFGGDDLISSYVNNGQLSSQFNFNLYDRINYAILEPNDSFESLDQQIKKSFEYYGYYNIMGNIMDSHDKNRFMSHADGDLALSQWSATEEGWNNPPMVDHPSSYRKAELYYAYLHTIPGIPVIYYGSEFGMSGASDPDNRRQMRFDSDLNQYEREMLDVTREIVKTRNNNSALRYGDYYTLQADKEIYAFIRSDFNQRILVILNRTDKPVRASLTLPAGYIISEVTDVLNGESIEIERELVTTIVPPIGFRILELKK